MKYNFIFLILFSFINTYCNDNSTILESAIYLTQYPLATRTIPKGWNCTWNEIIKARKVACGFSIEYNDGSCNQYEIEAFYSLKTKKTGIKSVILFLACENGVYPASQNLSNLITPNGEISLENILYNSYINFPNRFLVINKYLSYYCSNNLIGLISELVSFYIKSSKILQNSTSLDELYALQQELGYYINILTFNNYPLLWVKDVSDTIEHQITCLKYKPETNELEDE